MHYEELRDEIKAAMRNKDKRRLSILRQVLGDIDQWKIDNIVDKISSDDVDRITKKVLKQTRETYEASVKAANDDKRTETLAYQIDVLEELLPAMLQGEELEAAVCEAIEKTGAESPRDMGKVMGYLSGQFGESFDKGQAAQIAKSKLTA